MSSSTARFFDRSPGWAPFGLSPYVAGFSLIFLLWNLLSGAEVHGNVEYGFSLLAGLGVVGCLGHLAAYAYRSSEYLFSVFSVLGGAESLRARHSGGVLIASADRPLLVALLFGPFSMLLAGLGGWV